MPTFHIIAPDGAKYRVTGPEGATEAQALDFAAQHYAAQGADASSAAPTLEQVLAQYSEASTLLPADHAAAATPLTLAIIVAALGSLIWLVVGLRRKPKRWPRVVAAVAPLVVVAAVFAWAAWPADWSRRTCLDDASRRPTDSGVRVALSLCEEKFPKN